MVCYNEPLIWSYIVAALPALAAVFCWGRGVVGAVMNAPTGPTYWFEPFAPVKGRWLRLLTMSPSIAVGGTIIFLGVWFISTLGPMGIYYIVSEIAHSL